MYKHSLEYSSKPIEVYAFERLAHDVLVKLDEVIQYLKYDLNKEIRNSSAYFFNHVPVFTPTHTNEYFIDFLNENARLTSSSMNQYQPFFLEEEVSSDIDIYDSFETDGEVFVKTEDIKLDTSLLQEAYIVDHIFSLLEDHTAHSFKISSAHHTRIAAGKKWELSFEYERNKIFKTEMSGGTKTFVYPEYKETKKPNIPLTNEYQFQPYFCVVETPTCMDGKVLSAIIEHKRTKKEFEDTAFLYKSQIIGYDSSFKSHVFNPL
jgi:hypothetical protein